MLKTAFYEVREKLLSCVKPLEKEEVYLDKCAGKVLAQDVVAKINVPPFNRSAYDGYAFCWYAVFGRW